MDTKNKFDFILTVILWTSGAVICICLLTLSLSQNKNSSSDADVVFEELNAWIRNSGYQSYVFVKDISIQKSRDKILSAEVVLLEENLSEKSKNEIFNYLQASAKPHFKMPIVLKWE